RPRGLLRGSAERLECMGADASRRRRPRGRAKRRRRSEISFRPRFARPRGLRRLLASAPIHSRRSALPRSRARREPHERDATANRRPTREHADARAVREARALRRLRNVDSRRERRRAACDGRDLLLALVSRTRRRLAPPRTQVRFLKQAASLSAPPASSATSLRQKTVWSRRRAPRAR